jgi:nitrite reductase (NADH) large subunit
MCAGPGRKAQFGGIPRSNSLKVLGVEMFSIGVVEADGADFHVVDEEPDGGYLRLVFRDDRLVGAILLGDAGPTASVKKAIERPGDLGQLLKTKPRAIDIVAHLQSMGT